MKKLVRRDYLKEAQNKVSLYLKKCYQNDLAYSWLAKITKMPNRKHAPLHSFQAAASFSHLVIWAGWLSVEGGHRLGNVGGNWQQPFVTWFLSPWLESPSRKKGNWVASPPPISQTTTPLLLSRQNKLTQIWSDKNQHFGQKKVVNGDKDRFR